MSSRRPPTSSGTGSRRSRPSHPEPGEDEALDTQAKRLRDADALRAAADEARASLVGDVTGDLGGDELPQDATAALSVAQRALAASDDPTLVMLAQDVADAVAVVSDVAGQLAGYVADLDADRAASPRSSIGAP